MLTHEKFGVRLYVGTSNDAEALGQEILTKLATITGAVEADVLKKLARRRMTEGRVTVLNQAAYLRRMYEYFRERAEKSLKDSEAADTKELGEPGEPDWLTKGSSRHFQRLETGSFNALAAINAYFSWLEHVLVLALAFTDQDASEGTLDRHMRAPWSEKFRRVLDMQEADANRMLGRLREVAETYRNPYAHGGFDKLGATVSVHLPGIGPVPARLTDVRRSPHFALYPFAPDSFADVINVFAAVDGFLRTGPLRLAIRYVEYNMDVPVDKRSRHQIRNAMASDERFEALLSRWSRLVDQYANMDF